MSELPYIINEPLPLTQDYKSLKEGGLAYIQSYSGNEWTNLNTSDPGVTILDQLCYALTELGYCNDFSISDILTGVDGKLIIKDQFYLPEQILTTSPLTIEDYRKYIIDAVEEVKNVIIDASTTIPGPNNVYNVYLLIDPLVTDEKEIGAICNAVLYCLNKCRNLGELFLLPSPLQPVSHFLNGSIEIDKNIELNTFLLQIQNAIQNFIFPAVIQSGYGQLVDKGLTTDEIFNGPLLVNGWIPSDSLGEKRNSLKATDLVNLISSLPGVKSVSGISFDDLKTPAREIQCNSNQVLAIDVIKSVENGNIEILCKGNKLAGNSKIQLNPSLHSTQTTDILIDTAVQIRAELPKGKFRDIQTYYSIQNTFPEIFSVGANAIISNASNFQIAQSRQLKGYLLLFDQILANQFSQLASIDKLFSFRNSSYSISPAKKTMYHVREPFASKTHEYPVPYRVFSPTYFCQPLYDVPNIKPLLKDNDTFKFSITIESEKELEYKAWIDYKKDPYNPYIKGLMEYMEDDSLSLTRRNDILDHLLARHGESPLVIDSFIDGSLYSGNNLKDSVIFKSLYLQNLGLLSYFRQKAYDYIAAGKIPVTISDVPENYEQEIFNIDTKDFIFNSSAIDHIEKLEEQDFTNYSALELKLNLLFGLKTLYKDYIDRNYNDKESKQNIKLAYWMIQQRKGIIFLENNLLLQSPQVAASMTLDTEVVLIFPDFIPQFNTAQFKNRLDLFLQNTLPVQLPYKYHFVNAGMLEKIIPAFINWHNNLIYKDNKNVHSGTTTEAASTMIDLINQINRSGNA